MKVKVGFLACHSENYFDMENNVIEHCLQGVMELANTYGCGNCFLPAYNGCRGTKKAEGVF